MTGPDPSRAEAPPAEPSDAPPGAAAGVTVLVCATCRREGDGREAPRRGAELADALAARAGGEVTVKRVACLANCNRGLSVALCRPGCWTYVFGGLDEGSGADLIETARLFATATDGFLPWRGRPEALKRGLIARVPPLDILKDLP